MEFNPGKFGVQYSDQKFYNTTQNSILGIQATTEPAQQFYEIKTPLKARVYHMTITPVMKAYNLRLKNKYL